MKRAMTNLFGLMASVAVVVSIGACRSSPVAMPQPKDGAALFLTLCASCHGELGRGDGPVAPLLVNPPPDLTSIAQRNNGFFPALEVERVIDGRTGRAVHGTRNMPVWGRQLYFSADANDPVARARADEAIRLLSEHIRSLQVQR